MERFPFPRWKLLPWAALACVTPVAGKKAAAAKTTRPETVIAYPGGTMHLHRGLYGAFVGGLRRNYGENQNLFQWQGEGGYFYTPWFSSGLGFKLIAGEPSDTTQLVKNRFFFLGRFHKAWSRFSGYLGTQLGVDDLNVSLPADTATFQEPLRETNAGMGLEFGMGWRFSRYGGITFGHIFEFSFVGEDADRNAANFRTLPGLSFDLIALVPSLRKSVKAFNIMAEVQIGTLVLEKRSRSREIAGVTGFSAGF